MDEINNLSNEDVVRVLTLIKYENHANQTEDEKHVQRSVARLECFVSGYGARIQDRTGVDLHYIFNQYGLFTRHQVKSLAKAGYFQELSRTVDLKTNLYPDKFYLIGVWYHRPNSDAVDFHRLTQRDVDNLVDLMIASFVGDDKLDDQVRKRNDYARRHDIL